MYTLLPKEAITKTDALEAFFKEMHDAYEKQKVPMTEWQARHFITVAKGSNEQAEKAIAELSNSHWQFKGFFKRCEIFPIKYEKKLLLMLAILTNEFGIGGMILVSYYVQWWASKRFDKRLGFDINELPFDLFFKECMPFGVLTKQTVHEFWDKQKVSATPDNLIDHPLACKSFMDIERTETITHKDH